MTKNNKIINTFSKAESVDPIFTKKIFEIIENGSEIDRINLKENLYKISLQIKDKVNDPMYIIRDIYKIVKKYSIIIGRSILRNSGIEDYKIAILSILISELVLKFKPNIC